MIAKPREYANPSETQSHGQTSDYITASTKENVSFTLIHETNNLVIKSGHSYIKVPLFLVGARYNKIKNHRLSVYVGGPRNIIHLTIDSITLWMPDAQICAW